MILFRIALRNILATKARTTIIGFLVLFGTAPAKCFRPRRIGFDGNHLQARALERLVAVALVSRIRGGSRAGRIRRRASGGRRWYRYNLNYDGKRALRLLLDDPEVAELVESTWRDVRGESEPWRSD